MNDQAQDTRTSSPLHHPVPQQTTSDASGYWAGTATGASQGPMIAWVDERHGFKANVLFRDAVFGSSLLSLIGSRNENFAFLTIDHIRTVAPGAQLGSAVFLDFRQPQQITGVAFSPAGFVNLQFVSLPPSHWNKMRWYWRRTCTWFFTNGPSLYFIVLLAFFLAHSLGRILPSLSWIDLVLLLIPAPLLFQRAIARLLLILTAQSAIVLSNLGAHEINVGPLNLRIAKIAPRAESLNRLRYIVGPLGELVLMWLFYEDSIPRDSFNARLNSLAALTGVPSVLTETLSPISVSNIALYVQTRISALGLADSSDEQFRLTTLGRDFAEYLFGSHESGERH